MSSEFENFWSFIINSSGKVFEEGFEVFVAVRRCFHIVLLSFKFETESVKCCFLALRIRS